MGPVVDLQEVADALSSMSDELRWFVDRQTGKVILIMPGDLRAVEEEDEEDESEDPEDDELSDARNLFLDPQRFEELPDKFEVNDWEIMREFCESVRSESKRERLLNAIHGRGAFRYFKDLAEQYHLLEDWYAFQENAHFDIAREWCEENGLEYTEKNRRVRTGNKRTRTGSADRKP
jgi:hypothetical protein